VMTQESISFNPFTILQLNVFEELFSFCILDPRAVPADTQEKKISKNVETSSFSKRKKLHMRDVETRLPPNVRIVFRFQSHGDEGNRNTLFVLH
jgi:hypothetical protein